VRARQLDGVRHRRLKLGATVALEARARILGVGGHLIAAGLVRKLGADRVELLVGLLVLGRARRARRVGDNRHR
jgi:hypothetical protein